MRELKNKHENKNEFQLEGCTKEFTSSLKDLVMMATISSIIFLGLSIVVAFNFNMGDIIIFSMLLISWLLCTIVTIIKYYNFKVIREVDNIKLTYGLFHKKEIIIPVKGIQSLVIVEGVIKKPLGYFSLKVETMDSGNGKGECRMICPIAKSKVLNKFFEDILPEMNITYELRNSSPKALNGFLLFRLVQEVMIIGLIAMFLPYGYCIFIIIPILLLWHNIRFNDNGMYYGNDFVVMRFRKLDRKTVIIHKECIQSFEKQQNIFQKKKAIARYKVTIAGNSLGKSYAVGYMSENNHKSYSSRAVVNL
ncbi:PH domain-containing protein [Clostridium estertheticum]|uniref:PH domain-containing protein n=1 Tax=Clostridium estertheticum TaxID=238834 RepID=UPI0013E922CF|nr:PH domain-containing protein [Clostridium estertheticum]MBZ9688798.1 PH domain-containing protein [Clostridium estertheticum]